MKNGQIHTNTWSFFIQSSFAPAAAIIDREIILPPIRIWSKGELSKKKKPKEKAAGQQKQCGLIIASLAEDTGLEAKSELQMKQWVIAVSFALPDKVEASRKQFIQVKHS